MFSCSDSVRCVADIHGKGATKVKWDINEIYCQQVVRQLDKSHARWLIHKQMFYVRYWGDNVFIAFLAEFMKWSLLHAL